MSVDYLVCEHCGETFADCGYFVSCESCCSSWCSDECAEADGYKMASCKLGYDIDDVFPDDERCDKERCTTCVHFEEVSCGYCREEIFDDNKLLHFAIKKLGLENKEQLTELLRNDIKNKG